MNSKEITFRDFLLYLKQEHRLSSKKIAQETSVPVSTIEKTLSGVIKNNRQATFEKVISVYKKDYENLINSNKIKTCYVDPNTEKLLQKINSNPFLKSLCETSSSLKKSDIKVINEVAKRMAMLYASK